MFRPSVLISTQRGVREYTPTGKGFSSKDKQNTNLCKLLEMAWISLLSDSIIDPVKPPAVYNRFFYEMETDLFGLIDRYDNLAHELVSAAKHNETHNQIKIRFLSSMLDTPIAREYLHYYKTGDFKTLQYIYTFLTYGSKLKVDMPELEQTALRKWLELEDSILMEFPEDIVAFMKEFLEQLFVDWSDADFLPVHGPGAVREKGIRSILEKNTAFSVPSKVRYLYTKYHGSLIFPSEWTTRDLPKCESRLIFVPKKYNSYRSICAEPIGLQWSQQAVRLWIEEAISEQLGNFVKLPNQDINKSAAEFGSMTNLVDTIDLSSASDSVSWGLVRRIFPIRVLKHLYATRSTSVILPSGKTRSLNKFAPMGSSLCFPIQTIIYSTVVVLATFKTHFGIDRPVSELTKELKQNGWKHLFARNLSTNIRTGLYQPFRCYGDDIVTDYRTTSNTMDLLTQLGFKVNERKSFIGLSSFRESCGGFYMSGFDCSPMYFKIPRFGDALSVQAASSIIDHINMAFSRRYSHLRSVLINFVKRYPIGGVEMRNGLNPILFSDDPSESLAILTDRPLNRHLLFRKAGSTGTSLQYQRDEVCSMGIKTAAEIEVIRYDNYHYTAWVRSRYRSTSEPGFSRGRTTAAAVSTVPCRRWTPAR